MKKLQGRIRIKIKGLNQERTFNSLAKEVEILKLERQDAKICQIEVSPKDVKKTKKILINNNFEILSEDNCGVYKWRKWIMSCYGIIAGLIICLLAFVGQMSFVWQIKVYGNDRVNGNEITQVINQNLTSRLKTQIDCKLIEICIKENFERVSSVSVAIIGQCLVVNINEKVLPDEMISEFSPILSKYDCMITGIELIQGTLMVKEGDIVRKGDILVEPYIIDSQGQRRDVKAVAKITADVWLIGSYEHSESYLRTYRTGKKIENSEVLLFGLPIYSNSKDILFKEYDVEEKIENLTVNNILPFKIKKKVFYEIKSELVETKFSDCKDEIIENARQNALQNKEDYEIIKEENYTITNAGSINVVTYIVTVEREIGGLKNDLF